MLLGGWKYKPELFDSTTTQINNEISNTHSLGQVLYRLYSYFSNKRNDFINCNDRCNCFTFRQREGVKTQSYLKQISRERSEGIEVLEVPSNKGVKIDD